MIVTESFCNLDFPNLKEFLYIERLYLILLRAHALPLEGLAEGSAPAPSVELLWLAHAVPLGVLSRLSLELLYCRRQYPYTSRKTVPCTCRTLKCLSLKVCSHLYAYDSCILNQPTELLYLDLQNSCTSLENSCTSLQNSCTLKNLQNAVPPCHP